jgi:hypothetical protein
MKTGVRPAILRFFNSTVRVVLSQENNVLLLDGTHAGYHFLFQLPNPLLQELPFRFLLRQRQSFLVRGPSLSGPAEPAVHICAG